jgi:ribosomal protein L7Ae-like RNA K-turn-binding protein
MSRWRAPRAKVDSFLGLSRRAGALVLGRTACRRAVANGTCHLLVVAAGAGASALIESGGGGRVPILESELSKEELGQRLGRSSLAVLGMTDADLARGLLQTAESLPE